MRSEKFGENIFYFYKDKTIKNDIVSLVKENNFSDFSREGITSYLTFRHPIGNITMFDGYTKLGFGNELHNGKEISFWHPRFGECSDTFQKSAEKVDVLLKNSINKLIRGKNRIAVAVSGGVDSSLIVAMIRTHYPGLDIYTYSAGFYGDDEFEYSRLVSSENNTIHKEKVLNSDDFISKKSMLSSLIEFKGSPLHPNELALAEVENMAREDGCDIVLCGEGSDDIFGGYGQNFRMYMNYDHNESFFKFFLNNYRYFSLSDRKIINDKYLVDDFELMMELIHPKELSDDIKNWAFYFTQKIHTPGLITRGANAMRYNGFPLGFPYIDNKFVEYTNSLPFEYKVAWKSEKDRNAAKDLYFRDVSEQYDIPKFIIKKVAEKYLNHRIIYRPKKGFPVPFEKWFQDLKEWDFDSEVFISTDISKYSGWKKFMLINLDAFVKIFSKFKK